MSTRHSKVSSQPSSEDTPSEVARTFVTQDFILDCKGKTPSATPPESRVESKEGVDGVVMDVGERTVLEERTPSTDADARGAVGFADNSNSNARETPNFGSKGREVDTQTSKQS